jgi:hypothetical protein
VNYFGVVSKTHVEIDCWLTIDAGDPKQSWNRRPGVKVSAGEPSLTRQQRAMNLKIKLPLALFETPSLSATINVDQPLEAVHIDAEAIAEAVRGAIGMDVDLRIIPPADPEEA